MTSIKVVNIFKNLVNLSFRKNPNLHSCQLYSTMYLCSGFWRGGGRRCTTYILCLIRPHTGRQIEIIQWETRKGLHLSHLLHLALFKTLSTGLIFIFSLHTLWIHKYRYLLCTIVSCHADDLMESNFDYAMEGMHLLPMDCKQFYIKRHLKLFSERSWQSNLINLLAHLTP